VRYRLITDIRCHPRAAYNIKGFVALLMDLTVIATLKVIVQDFAKSVDQ
jgi:hypothetical protein